MKKILVSLVILTTASSLIFATTRAVWTHTVSIKGNKIETGNAEIQVTTKESPLETDWSNSEQNSNLVLSGLVPGGESKSGYSFSLRNTSTSDIGFNLSGLIPDMQTSDGNPDISELRLRIFDYENPDDGSDWLTLSDWSTVDMPLNLQLPKNTTKKFGIEARLDSEADDQWQNQNVNFELQIIGTQI